MGRWPSETIFKGQDVRAREFNLTMERDGIPAKEFESENWTRWIQEKWARILAMRKN